MAALATVAALESRLGVAPGSLTGENLARATSNLDDASALVRAEGGREWADPAQAPAVVVMVALQVALRAYRNPEGFVSESLGAYTYRLADGLSSVYLTDEERRIVWAAGAGGSLGIGSVAIVPATGDQRYAAWDDFDFGDGWTS